MAEFDAKLLIRQGSDDDALACGEIMAAAHRSADYAQRLPHLKPAFAQGRPLPTGGRHRLLAERDGVVVGFADVMLTTGKVQYLYVEPGAQGGGIGNALLHEAEALIAGPININVLMANERALRWYLRHGYAIAGGGHEDNWNGGSILWVKLMKVRDGAPGHEKRPA